MLLICETLTWKPHIETAIEIALRRREAQEAVVFATMRQGLPICEDRLPIHRLLDLPAARTRRARPILEGAGVRWFEERYAPNEIRCAEAIAAEAIAGCRDFDDLKRLRHDAFHDIGWGVLSSVISLARDAQISFESQRDAVRAYYQASVMVYERTRELIRRHAPDQVLLFNGRFATTRAVLRAAEECGVPWLAHERGGDKSRYWVGDFLPHQMDQMQDAMLRAWNPSRAPSAHAWFQARRQRIEREWHSFARQQEVGRLPPGMRDSGEWAVFFTSSEDEMVAIGDEYSNRAFPDQFDAVRQLALAAAAVGVGVCVRVHPHVREKVGERERWARLAIPGVLVVPPEDPADSYAMIDRARVVCTYGSTVGVEATYWGRPSLLFAQSYYDRLGVSEPAGDHAAIARFLREPTCFPQEKALPYGAFFEDMGEPFRYYEASGLHSGRICGIALDDAPTIRVARAIARALPGVALRRD